MLNTVKPEPPRLQSTISASRCRCSALACHVQVLLLQQQAGDESAAWEARLAAVQDTLAARDRAATALERELALRPTHEQARCGQSAPQ